MFIASSVDIRRAGLRSLLCRRAVITQDGVYIVKILMHPYFLLERAKLCQLGNELGAVLGLCRILILELRDQQL